MKKILIIGGTSRHMQRMIKYVAPEVNGIQLDMFCVGDNHVSFDGADNVYYSERVRWPLRLFTFVPKINSRLLNRAKVKTLIKLVDKVGYDVVNIHQPAFWQLPFVEYVKKNHLKIIISPWGSDVLRCPIKRRKEIGKILNCADYITSNAPEFTNKLISIYNFNPKKMYNLGFGSEIFSLIPQLNGKMSKQEIAKDLHVAEGDYYIACGYTAQRAQRHLQMVEAIAANKDVLPKNTILLFQFTYGNNADIEYQNEIANICDRYNIRYHFLTLYLSNEDVAKLRLLVDLFIHIQPTDANSASLREYLLAGAQCINGQWLRYPDLEVDGTPYHLCNSVEELPSIICQFFNNKMPKKFISDRVSNYILSFSWDSQSKRWADFFYSL